MPFFFFFLLVFSEFFQYSKWRDINVNDSVLARTHRICVSNSVCLSTQFLLYIYKAVDKVPQIFWFLWLSPEGLQRSLLMLLQKFMVIKELILLCQSIRIILPEPSPAIAARGTEFVSTHSLPGWNNHCMLALPFPVSSFSFRPFRVDILCHSGIFQYLLLSNITLLICHIN